MPGKPGTLAPQSEVDLHTTVRGARVASRLPRSLIVSRPQPLGAVIRAALPTVD